MPPPKKRQEKPTEAFEKLRQCFDVIKEKHTDPWNWHEYLDAEPTDDDEDDGDPEALSLKPKARSNVEKLKSHLLATVAQLNTAASAADMCYYHMCTNPQDMKDCAMILGTSGDVDEELLASGDVSPQKMMAALQSKLDTANEQVAELTTQVVHLKDSLVESRSVCQERFLRWQTAAMAAEEATMRLHWMKLAHDNGLRREEALQATYRDLYWRMVRAKRLMIYKARQLLRDRVFNCNKKENLFYSFHGFCEIIRTEKEERLRREYEEQRNAIEFALRNEVRFLLREGALHRGNIERLAVRCSTLKKDRRNLACRLLHKNRPYETLEYCLWVWELWQPVRGQLALEKALETEQAFRDAAEQQLVHTSAQFPPLLTLIEQLKLDAVAEKVAHDESRRELTADSAKQLAAMAKQLHAHRAEEVSVVSRLYQLDMEDKDERIAVLEREIAEDKHISALKGMVVDLESNLRFAMDRRKQRGFVVPPAPTDANKCAHCSREVTFNTWRGLPKTLSHSLSETNLRPDGPPPLLGGRGLDLPGLPGSKGAKMWQSPPERSGTFSAVWR